MCAENGKEKKVIISSVEIKKDTLCPLTFSVKTYFINHPFKKTNDAEPEIFKET